jgi:ribosomal protein S18 acetylase RimI-like enzyme
MEIRAATERDLGTLEALFEELDGQHRERLPTRFRAPTERARSHEHLLGLLAKPSTILIAGDLGFVHVVLRDALAAPIFVPRRFAMIDNLVVAARARRRGIGRALVAAADEWARQRGATDVELAVYAINDEALAFYRALGFADLVYRLTRSCVPSVS